MKNQVLGRVVRAALLLYHGSTGVERGFSRSAQLMTSIQARIEEQTLNAKACAADATRNYESTPEIVPIIKKLLCLVDQLELAINFTLLAENRVNWKKRSLKLKRKMLNWQARTVEILVLKGKSELIDHLSKK